MNIRAMICVGGMLAVAVAFAEITYDVSDVNARQRYPWNGKVDVDFRLNSSDSEAKYTIRLEALDLVGKTNLSVRTVRYDDEGIVADSFELQSGKHRLTWDAGIDMPNQKLPRVSFAVYATLVGSTFAGDYLVIDLSSGPNSSHYEVTSLTDVPTGGWSDTYKTTKLVLRKCPAGKYPKGGFTLTKEFYAGVFEVTQKQWLLVMGKWPDTSSYGWYTPSEKYGLGDTLPAYDISYYDVRGDDKGAQWPNSADVDATSFIGKLRARTGLVNLDLPTRAQWKYACRAGTMTTYNTGDGDAALSAAGWWSYNSGGKMHGVGQKLPNAWGLYDMHGNVTEMSLDRVYGSAYGSATVDPVGPAPGLGDTRDDRYVDGGCWMRDAGHAALDTSMNWITNRDSRDYEYGFRIFMTIP